MESALLGLVLDSSAVISAERKKQPIPKFIEAMLRTHGPLDLSLSPVTVAELVVRIHAGEPRNSRLKTKEYFGVISLTPSLFGSNS